MFWIAFLGLRKMYFLIPADSYWYTDVSLVIPTENQRNSKGVTIQETL